MWGLLWEPPPASAKKSNVSGHKCSDNGVRMGRQSRDIRSASTIWAGVIFRKVTNGFRCE